MRATQLGSAQSHKKTVIARPARVRATQFGDEKIGRKLGRPHKAGDDDLFERLKKAASTSNFGRGRNLAP
jgi:hypothetical protein